MSDPLCLGEWPSLLWDRSFTFNMPYSEYIDPTKGGVIVYLAQSCTRIHDNLALRAAMWLSTRVGIPLVALTLLEKELVQDVRHFTQMSGAKRATDSNSSSLSVARSQMILQSQNRIGSMFALSRALRSLSVPLVGAVVDTNEEEVNPSRLCSFHSLFPADSSKLFVLITDEFLHPLHAQICSEFSCARNIPCLAFDSNRICIQNENSFEHFESSMRRLVEIDWMFAVDMEGFSRVQQLLQFQHIVVEGSKVFVPLELCFANCVVFDWAEMENILSNFNDYSSMDEQQLFGSVQKLCEASTLLRSDEDFILCLVMEGRLSPKQLCAWTTEGESAQSLRERLAHFEIAISAFSLGQTVAVKKDVHNSSWVIDWFSSLDDQLWELLLQPNNPLGLAQQLTHQSGTFAFTPKDAQKCITGIRDFDELQRRLLFDKYCVLRRHELVLWILTYLFALPTNLALQIIFQQWSLLARVPFIDCTTFPILFLLAIRDICNMVETASTSANAGSALLNEYNNLKMDSFVQNKSI